jgi:hypothetical protein
MQTLRGLLNPHLVREVRPPNFKEKATDLWDDARPRHGPSRRLGVRPGVEVRYDLVGCYARAHRFEDTFTGEGAHEPEMVGVGTSVSSDWVRTGQAQAWTSYKNGR